MEVIKSKRILALVGITGLLLGCFLPYYTVSIFGYTQSISLWGYWEGKIVFILALANTLFIFQDVIEKYIPQLFNNWVGKMVQKANNPKFSLIPTILVAAFSLYMLFQVNVDSEYIKYGLGFWVLWIGVLSLIGHAIFYRKQNIQPLQSVQQVQPQMESQQPMNSMKQCPQCGNTVDSSAQFCVNCGNRF